MLAATAAGADDGYRINRLAVMSFNMWHRDRPGELQAVARAVRADLPEAPDFILCQEVVFGRRGSADNTAAVLAQAMGYHCRGTKRTSDREGIAIVSRFPFDYYDHLHLEAQTSRLLLGFRRVSVMGEFLVPDIGRVRIVNIHFTNWDFEHHIRRRQLAQTLDWIKQRERLAPAAVTILGGDFNAKPWWEEMRQIKTPLAYGNLDFKDFNGAEPTRDGSRRIDNLFIFSPKLAMKFLGETLFWRDGLTVGSSRVHISDHLCVMQRYAFERRPAVAATSSPPTGDASR